MAYELDYVAVRNEMRLVYPFIGRQRFPATSPISDEKFSIYQIVSRHLTNLEKPIQLRGVGGPVC